MKSKFQIFKLNEVKSRTENFSEKNFGLISVHTEEHFEDFADAEQFLKNKTNDYKDNRELIILKVFSY